MRTLLIAAMLPLSMFVLAGTAVADTNNCVTTTECSFHCHAGETVFIQVFGPLGEVVYGEAFCGTLGMHCSGVGQGATSTYGHVCEFVVTSGGGGTCYHHIGWKTACGTELYIN